MTTTYGIISDLHRIDYRAVIPAIQALEQEGVDALVLNGDLVGEQSGFHTHEYLAAVLDIAGKSGFSTYILPGSHEEVQEFEPVVRQLCSQHGNIINTFQHPKIEHDDHHLVFLQGSDWRAGNAVKKGYALQDEHESGFYKNEEGDELRVVNMNDLRRQVTHPERTIVFSHVPPQFNFDGAVDVAEFGEVIKPFKVNDEILEAGSVLPGQAAYSLVQQGAPIALKKQNRGNGALRRLFAEMGIEKSINGHFHESAGRAHDQNGKVVEDGLFVNSLFYNASCLDRGMVGMVSVDDTKVAYEKIDLRKYS
ncbi:metallophosphoesterase [Candidatus Woesearchaeota archaeon]|nr:metallophosphoesterase [Candidatus Woesearchaeota archaeon]